MKILFNHVISSSITIQAILKLYYLLLLSSTMILLLLSSISLLLHPLLLTVVTSFQRSFVHLIYKHSCPFHRALYPQEVLKLHWKALVQSFKSSPTNARTACTKLFTTFNWGTFYFGGKKPNQTNLIKQQV